MLDANLQRPDVARAGEVRRRSAARRSASSSCDVQPLLGLHGHIHEATGIRRLGRTIAINPGSDYSTGALNGALITLERDEGRGSPARAGLRTPCRAGEMLVAVDVGTSGARAAAFDLDGRRLLEVRRPYADPLAASRLGRAGRRGVAVLRARRDPGPRLIAPGRRPRRRASASPASARRWFSSTSAGDRSTAGLMYRDNRAAREADELRERFGAAAIHRRTGHLPRASTSRRSSSGCAGTSRRVFDARGMASPAAGPRRVRADGRGGDGRDARRGDAPLDLRARAWDPELADAIGIDRRLLPPVVASTTVVGDIRPNRSPAHRPVRRACRSSSGERTARRARSGSASSTPGPVSEMAGSSTCLNAVVERAARRPRGHALPARRRVVVHDRDGDQHDRRGRRLVGRPPLRRSDRARPSAPTTSGSTPRPPPFRPGADGVLVLPVLARRRAHRSGSPGRVRRPLAAARPGGRWRGRSSRARAFAMRAQLELLARRRRAAHELRVSGGDTRLGTWNRIKADVTGLPVRTVEGDAASAGVAMLAGLGVGRVPRRRRGDPALRAARADDRARSSRSRPIRRGIRALP